MSSYNEMKYWSSRHNPNAKNPNMELINCSYDFIKQFIKEDSKILFYGPGTGRDLEVLSINFNGEVYFIDITDRYRNDVFKIVKDNFKNSITRDFIILDSPVLTTNLYEDNFFDLIISSQVFLHQKPEYIMENIKELYKISNKLVLTAFYNPDLAFDKINKKINECGNHCFNHDYFDIFEKLNIKVSKYKQVNNQIFLMVEK